MVIIKDNKVALSKDSRYLPRIQQAISNINIIEAQTISEKMLTKPKISELAQSLE